MLQTWDITNEGRRGRPSHPVERDEFRLAILNARGTEVGVLELVAKGNGVECVITPEGGKARKVSLAAPKAKASKAKAKAATAEPVSA